MFNIFNEIINFFWDIIFDDNTLYSDCVDSLQGELLRLNNSIELIRNDTIALENNSVNHYVFQRTIEECVSVLEQHKEIKFLSNTQHKILEEEYSVAFDDRLRPVLESEFKKFKKSLNNLHDCMCKETEYIATSLEARVLAENIYDIANLNILADCIPKTLPNDYSSTLKDIINSNNLFNDVNIENHKHFNIDCLSTFYGEMCRLETANLNNTSVGVIYQNLLQEMKIVNTQMLEKFFFNRSWKV